MRVLLPAFVLWLSAAAAGAQTADPEALLREGVALRRAHRDAEALARFHDAWRVAHSPRALAQVGLAEQALGRWVQAEAHVREAAAADDPWIAQNAAALGAALGVIGQHLGSLWVEGLDGAEVFVDGQRVTTLPMTAAARVVAGSLQLEVRAAGFDPVTRPITVSPRGEVREVVRLTPTAAPSTVTITVARPPAVAPGAGSVTAGTTSRTFAWVSLTGALVGAGVGLGALAAMDGLANAYNADRACPGIAAPGAQPARCQGRVDEAATFETLGVATLVVGGALAVTSIVLFATARRRERVAERATVSCGPNTNTWGVTCAGRF
jgi:hypothetical protein